MAMEPPLDVDAGRCLLFDVVDLLDRHDIPYHLEGGTLLGIVRDGDLLPWDHDLDISIPATEISRLDARRRLDLRLKLWRVSVRRFTRDDAEHGWRHGDLRILKIAKRKYLFERGWPRLDIFGKYEAGGRVHWVAKNRIMSVSSHHYAGHDTVEYFGRRLKIPRDVDGYLAAKYGEWRTPVKQWDCGKQELTISGNYKE